MSEWLTTAEAARISGVGTTSIKRWTEDGALPCSKTAGGHRRIRRSDLDDFLRVQRGQEPNGLAGRWLELMLHGDVRRLEGALLEARSRQRAWSDVADELGPSLTELGSCWERKEVSVLEEHVASERIARAISRIAESIPVHPDAPQCVLACVEREMHGLGLSLVELCLREAGWRSLWAGRITPVEEVERIVLTGEVQMVALSASLVSNDAAAMAAIAARISAACTQVGIPLALGGSGAWPEAGYHRFHRFDEFQRFATAALKSAL